MRNKKLLLLLVLLCFGASISIYSYKIINFYNNISKHFDYFNVADVEPEYIDVIFSFNADDSVRINKALKIFLKHENTLLVMSYNKSFSLLEKTSKQQSVAKRIYQIKNLRSTFEEVLNLRYFLDDNRKKGFLPLNKKKPSIALVSDGWHLKRIQMISNTLLRSYNVSFISAKNNEATIQNTELYKEEYHDMFFDWWRCFIWKFSFGSISLMAKRNKYEPVY